jgi:hypothetical protein
MWKIAVRKPFVGVIVLACGEPVPVVLRTAQALLDRSWPDDRLAVVVSDAASDTDLRDALAGGPVLYHVPEDYASPAGSALGGLHERFPHMVYVEVRDADDDPGSRDFFRHCVTQLEKASWLPFTQAGGAGILWRDDALEQLGGFPALPPAPAAATA